MHGVTQSPHTMPGVWPANVSLQKTFQQRCGDVVWWGGGGRVCHTVPWFQRPELLSLVLLLCILRTKPGQNRVGVCAPCPSLGSAPGRPGLTLGRNMSSDHQSEKSYFFEKCSCFLLGYCGQRSHPSFRRLGDNLRETVLLNTHNCCVLGKCASVPNKDSEINRALPAVYQRFAVLARKEFYLFKYSGTLQLVPPMGVVPKCVCTSIIRDWQ